MWYFAAQNLRWVNEVVERKRAAGNPSVWISSVQTALGPQGHPPTPPFTCPFCSGVQSQPRVSLAFPRKIHCPRMEEPPSGSAPCCKQKSFCLFSQHSCLCSPIWSLSQNPFFWNCSKNWGVERCLSEKDPQRCSLRCSEGRSVQLGLGGMSLEQETTCEAVSGWGRCWILPGIIPNSQWNTTENHLWALPGSKLSSSSHCAPDRSRLQWHRGSRTGFVGGGGGQRPSLLWEPRGWGRGWVQAQHRPGQPSTAPPALLASPHAAQKGGGGGDGKGFREAPRPEAYPPSPAPQLGCIPGAPGSLRGSPRPSPPQGNGGRRCRAARSTPGNAVLAPRRTLGPHTGETLPGPGGIRVESRAGSERESGAAGTRCLLPRRQHGPGTAGTPRGGDGTPVPELAPPRPSLQLRCALLATFSPPPCRFFAPSLQCRYSKVSCILLAVSLRSPCALLARSLLFLCTLHTIPCHPNSFHPPSNLLPLRSSPGTEGGGGEPSPHPPLPRRDDPDAGRYPLPLPSTLPGTAATAGATYLRAARRATSTGPWWPLCFLAEPAAGETRSPPVPAALSGARRPAAQPWAASGAPVPAAAGPRLRPAGGRLRAAGAGSGAVALLSPQALRRGEEGGEGGGIYIL